MTKENMRFVQIKTEEQLDVQAMHRVRDRLVQRRTRCPGLDLVSPGVPKTAGGNFLFEFSHRRHDHLFAFDLMTPSVTFGVPSSERAVGRTLSDLRLGSNNHLPSTPPPY